MLKAEDQTLLALSLLPRVGGQTIKKIFSATGIIKQPSEEILTKALSANNLSAINSYFIAHGWLFDKLSRILQLLDEHGIGFINFADPRYPDRLRQIPDFPIYLFYKGNVEVLSLPQIAIVGSRKASSSSLAHAYSFAQELAGSGLVVISGLAQGVDSAAHSAIVDIDAKTIAVMGTGLDRIYPVQHKQLANKILEHGCWVSEYYPGVQPIAANFPRRNRIISGLSLGVLIVEARRKSGTLITARMALEQNREVFAIPGPIEYAGSEGCHLLINDGAKLVQSIDDILVEIQMPCTKIFPETLVETIDLASPLSNVLDVIDFTQISLHQIALKCQLPMAQLSPILVELELLGWVEVIGSNIRRVK